VNSKPRNVWSTWRPCHLLSVEEQPSDNWCLLVDCRRAWSLNIAWRMPLRSIHLSLSVWAQHNTPIVPAPRSLTEPPVSVKVTRPPPCVCAVICFSTPELKFHATPFCQGTWKSAGSFYRKHNLYRRREELSSNETRPDWSHAEKKKKSTRFTWVQIKASVCVCVCVRSFCFWGDKCVIHYIFQWIPQGPRRCWVAQLIKKKYHN